ncbi:hypothetical protein CGMCC3_g17100 [Colletotrichum fructicola]|nr:uncharacterized protein CGMCC3_g17100 [Colletotrichum fructicola]KAE9566754.1 hypothetical protein CGMCC3_g17100 [Colletotrichum fructicola]
MQENACARHPEAGAFADAHAPTLAPSASNAQRQRRWDASQNGLSLHPTTKTPGPGSGRGLLRLPEHRGGAGELRRARVAPGRHSPRNVGHHAESTGQSAVDPRRAAGIASSSCAPSV